MVADWGYVSFKPKENQAVPVWEQEQKEINILQISYVTEIILG